MRTSIIVLLLLMTTTAFADSGCYTLGSCRTCYTSTTTSTSCANGDWSRGSRFGALQSRRISSRCYNQFGCRTCVIGRHISNNCSRVSHHSRPRVIVINRPASKVREDVYYERHRLVEP